MSEQLSAQLVLQHSIERALDNFKKVGKNNLTSAKVRSRIGALKELWRPYQEGHVHLTQTNPPSSRATLEYFSKAMFDRTEDVYTTTLDYIMDCLEEFEPPALTARFENKQRLLTSHLSTLFGLSAVSRESASDLQLLCDKINITIASLQKLERSPSNLWNDMLVHILSQKLDHATRKAWTLHTSHVETPPTYEDLNRFVLSRIRALEECSPASTAKPAAKSAHASRVNVMTASLGVSMVCPLCKSRHFLNHCPDFIAKNPNQRPEVVKRFKRCFNCLSTRHSAQECKSKYTCRSCDKRHHSVLHADSDSVAGASAVTPPPAPSAQSSMTTVEVDSLSASTKPGINSQVLLATAWVQIKVASGRSVTVRALIDQGSEATLISENVAQLLQAKRIRKMRSITAVGNVHAGTVRHAASITISSRAADTSSVSTIALILNSLTAYAQTRVSDLNSFPHISYITWANNDPTGSDPIQAILGADIYHDLLLDGRRKGMVGQLAARETIFGWIISGPLKKNSKFYGSLTGDSPAGRSSVNITVHHCTSLQHLAEDIRRFWEIEKLPQLQTLSPQDEQCEAHYQETHSRNNEGRYIVRLPFKKCPPIDIGRSRVSAERLYNSLSRRFCSSSDLANEYSEFMREYETLGHMRRVSETQAPLDQCVYFPHHPVFREGSATTHLRVVFNASSVTSNGSSLNDHLLAGPKLQTDLPAILLQWRQFKFVYTADVAKMYRQILVDQKDIDYQRVLWQGDTDCPIDYQLLTVTYGMTCAPYLALRVLKGIPKGLFYR
ncbi:uncharacterized protein LOC115244780 [Formica exsecta]|uniref:uncharacterized protein LOC115244780 n=1 Tax=Formica exsecta TaxID=72781 RepID=UPI001141F0B6|nr:uncharacterized protein LOC115244780 [Formica exsecta]